MKLNDVKRGDILIADGGFTCLVENARCVIKEDEGLYVNCAESRHYLIGQLDADGEIVGFKRVETQELQERI